MEEGDAGHHRREMHQELARRGAGRSHGREIDGGTQGPATDAGRRKDQAAGARGTPVGGAWTSRWSA
jgi:hypothetical protein